MSTNKRRTIINTLRSFFWPIQKGEARIVIPIAFMMFCVLFNLGMMKSLKDTLVVTSIGPEAISFIKLYFVLPIALLFTLLYFKLSNILSFHKLFTIITFVFISFFLIFAFWIFPQQDDYHFSPQFVSNSIEFLPNLKWPIKILGKWSYIISYLLAELWSAVVVNLLFWQLANQILDTKQATRIYLFLAMIGNLGLIAAGGCLKNFANTDDLPAIFYDNLRIISQDNMEITLKLVTLVITFSSIITIMLLYHLKYITRRRDELHNLSDSGTKTKLSLMDSIRIIYKSNYILCIATLVICYSLAINLVEGTWKDKVSQLYKTNSEYIFFMGNFNIATGLTCLVFTIIGSIILNRFGWFWAALISPITLGVSGILFFLSLFVINFYELDSSLLLVAIIIGSWQNIFSKAAKYSIFDATKEMAYIPLSVEFRSKGKAAVEVAGSKIGKSFGAILQATLFTIFPNATFDSIAPILFILFFLIVILWMRAVNILSEQYKIMLQKEVN
jgi:ADP/ATP carrier protein family